MDFGNLTADIDLILDRHYTPGRGGNAIDKVVVHYNAGDLTVEGCYSVWQTREASAHYQVESDGRIGQLVWDRDTAWHAGNWAANQTSIGVEHANLADGTLAPACLEAGAHLVAALCLAYGLGRPQWRVNVFPHWDFASTSCPGPGLGGSQNAEYMARAQAWYDAMASGASGAQDPEPAPQPEPEAPADGDGDFHGGLYTCKVDALNVRVAPSTSSEVVDQYHAGQTVELDDWYEIADGYVWARYTGYSGATRYVAVGRATGRPEGDDYLVKA